MHGLNKTFQFWKEFTFGIIQWQINSGLDNGSVPKWHQAIIQTEPNHWHSWHKCCVLQLTITKNMKFYHKTASADFPHNFRYTL